MPETGIEPTTSRLRLKINNGLVAGCISLISDSANQIDDLFDLEASLIRLIVRSQTGPRKRLHQCVVSDSRACLASCLMLSSGK